MDEDYEHDEGSDRDNWENEQVFQDHEGEESREDPEGLFDVDFAEIQFRDSYEDLFGVRPAFSVGHLSLTELLARTANLQAAQLRRQFTFA